VEAGFDSPSVFGTNGEGGNGCDNDDDDAWGGAPTSSTGTGTTDPVVSPSSPPPSGNGTKIVDGIADEIKTKNTSNGSNKSDRHCHDPVK